MTELGDIFAELGISQYLQDFLEQGFDTWDTILDITESDFDALGVKLGHRRKLQRKIANSRGLSSDRALASPRNTPTDERQPDEQKIVVKTDNKDASGGSHGAKRKYRRHPKPDENAPERPPSAYVIFSNKMREELKGRNLSFTEIAKLVGENWQNLSPAEKEPYEQQAFSDKERYNNELTEYKKTERYREYSQYLADFKARHSNPPQVPETESSKRPKLEAHGSSGTGSSGASQHGGDTPINRGRLESSASVAGQWVSETQRSPQSAPKMAINVLPRNPQGSPSLTSPITLPGYRDSIFAGGHPSLPWRDSRNDESVAPPVQQLPRISSVEGGHSNYQGNHHANALNLTGSQQHSHRTGQSHPPPLLQSESTNRSTTSSASTASSSYFTPRTPMEPPFDRALPIPALYSQKSFENQLPPLRPSSMSPQTTTMGMQQSPSGNRCIVDFPASTQQNRGYQANPSQSTRTDLSDPRIRDMVITSADDNLDPVSALIRAGEIVNQSSGMRRSS